ncbi:MAG TPA: pitrilysin family protein [Pirellulales bacterium]|nr:pitrilysin family protein [Pirellulales bacterium]
MKQTIETHVFANGLVLAAEPMVSLESAAFTFLIPSGCIYDPHRRSGLAALSCEMALRGAGERDSRRLIEDLENLGVQRGESVGSVHTGFSGATLAKNLPPALAIYADMLRRAHLPEEQLDAGRQVVIQELRAIEDEPSHKVMLELKRRHYPDPWGQPSEGDMESLEAIAIDDVRRHYRQLFRPNGTIIGVAGKIDWRQLVDQVGELLGDWEPQETAEPPEGARGPKLDQLHHESNQTQIGIAYPSVPYRHPDYFQASGAVGVLSGGMSSRLFTEVREKRGLCYTVYASYHTHRDRACVLCYAGTTAPRAQETLDVTLGQLRLLAKGVRPEELQRLKTRVKSSLVMQQESSSARSGAIARDWYHLGRVRTLDEVGRLVDELTDKSINRYLAENPPDDFTIVTLGSEPLKV